MNRTWIIAHYKDFFEIEETDEDDQIMIDWAEALLEDQPLPDISLS